MTSLGTAGRRLATPAALRALWLVLVALLLAKFVAGVVVRAQELQVVCLEPEAVCHQRPPRPTPADAATLAANGLTLRGYAALQVGKLVLFSSIWFLVGGLVFARRGADPMGLLTSFFLMTFTHGVDGIQDGLVRAFPGLLVPRLVLDSLIGVSYPLFVALFPNGKWAPRWTRWVILAALVLGVPQTVLDWTGRDSGIVNGLSSAASITMLGLLIIGQIIRYQRYSTPVERLQTRWVLAGMVGSLVLLLGLIGTVLALDIPQLSLAYFAGELVYQTAIVLIPLSIGLSILRYRLWDIDVIIRRTLIYSALSAVLALAYFGGILVLQSVFGALTGESRNALATVLSTLGIAALFGPVRGRVQRGIDRRFYRKKYDAARTLAGFGASVRDDVDLEGLQARLLGVVEETMQPAHASLWVIGKETREVKR
jgi:hypothetical protein